VHASSVMAACQVPGSAAEAAHTLACKVAGFAPVACTRIRTPTAGSYVRSATVVAAPSENYRAASMAWRSGSASVALYPMVRWWLSR
jgi:hypothetical protein